jgi:signal transduction histidine kinase
MDRLPTRPAPATVDRVLAIGCAVVGALSVRPGGGDQVGEPAAAVASLLGVVAGLTLLWRSRRPRTVAVAATTAWAAQALVWGPVVPFAPWLALHGLLRTAGPRGVAGAAAVAVLVLLGLVTVVAGGGSIAPTYLLVGALAAAVGLVGWAAAGRREAQRREAAAEERLRLARDLHDVVGHGLGAIAVQAGTGRIALDAGEAEETRRALLAIEETSRASLAETRWLLGLLRDGSAPGLTGLDGLLAAARRSGLDVSVTVEGDVSAVPAAVGSAAYRVVQEAITNVVRHAGAGHVEVVVHAGPPTSVEVRDDGAGHPASEAALGDLGGGHGLRGMRERVEALGGELETGPRSDGLGWRVVARWPRNRAAAK